jgi:hypothetical protein
LKSETLTSKPGLRREPVTVVQFGFGIGFSRVHFSIPITSHNANMDATQATSVWGSVLQWLFVHGWLFDTDTDAGPDFEGSFGRDAETNGDLPISMGCRMDLGY